MTSMTRRTVDCLGASTQVPIAPKILYFGTPVVLLVTTNPDGTRNLAPMSSAWALGHTVVLGLGLSGRTAANLGEGAELTINLPRPDQWSQVERLAPLTGSNPVPEGKAARSRYEPDKFAASGFTPVPSDLVDPPRVRECPLQFEACVSHTRVNEAEEFVIIEARVMRVHASPEIVIDGTDHVDPRSWSPLIYSFRHYFGLGEELGHSYRSETPAASQSGRDRQD